MAKRTEGYRMLQERGLPELTGEAIVLGHPRLFPRAAVNAAQARLAAAGVEDDTVLKPLGNVYACVDD